MFGAPACVSKLPKGTAKAVLFAFKLAKVEADKIQDAIKRSGMEKAEWARQVLLKAAEA